MRKATKVWMLLLAGAMFVVWSAPALGQAVSDARKAQNKLLAARAARADGIRKLAERINGLFITSETTVKDFVAESDTINTAMRAFLTGVREKGKPKWMEDGTCEVVMEVTIQEVVVALKQMCTKYYKGDKFKVAQFDQMTVTNKTKVLRETGMGAPRPDLAEEDLVPVGEAGLASMTNLRGAAKAYWMARCTGRGRLMAVRAARLDGLRRLSERIYGLMITSETLGATSSPSRTRSGRPWPPSSAGRASAVSATTPTNSSSRWKWRSPCASCWSTSRAGGPSTTRATRSGCATSSS